MGKRDAGDEEICGIDSCFSFLFIVEGSQVAHRPT